MGSDILSQCPTFETVKDNHSVEEWLRDCAALKERTTLRGQIVTALKMVWFVLCAPFRYPYLVVKKLFLCVLTVVTHLLSRIVAVFRFGRNWIVDTLTLARIVSNRRIKALSLLVLAISITMFGMLGFLIWVLLIFAYVLCFIPSDARYYVHFFENLQRVWSESLDEHEEIVAKEGMPLAVERKQRTGFACKLAVRAISKVGLLSATKANALVYQKVLLDEMRSLNVRYNDRIRILPLAIAACLDRPEEVRKVEECIKHYTSASMAAQGCLVRREGQDTSIDHREFNLSEVEGVGPLEVLTVTTGYSGKGKRTWYSFNSPASTYEYLVHNSSLINVARGLVERVFCVVNKTGKLVRPPKPAPGVLTTTLRLVGLQLSKTVGHCHQWTRDEFVMSYTGPRRASYGRAAATLDSEPLTIRDSYLSTFVKAEKINCTLKPDPAPRVIQPRGQRYNIEVGRYLKPLEPLLMKAIDKLWGSPTAIKGYTVEKVAGILNNKRLKYKNPVFVGLDASRFDQHCSVEALSWEHSVYNDIFRDPYLAELLQWQLVNRGTAYTSDGKIKYQVEGCRMSGDMNTSMGNYLIMSSLCYAFCQQVGLDAELMNCGDDCVLIFESTDLSKLKTLPNWFVKMGYTMKVEKPVSIMEEVEFCQMHPVRTSRGWVMVRRPDTVMTKDCCVVRGGMTVQKLQDWLGAQRDGGLALAGDVPILAAFYKAFPAKQSSMVSDYAAPHKFKAGKQYGSITEESRYSFWLAFGLTPDDQLAVEEELESFTFSTRLTEKSGPCASLLDYCLRQLTIIPNILAFAIPYALAVGSVLLHELVDNSNRLATKTKNPKPAPAKNPKPAPTPTVATASARDPEAAPQATPKTVSDAITSYTVTHPDSSVDHNPSALITTTERAISKAIAGSVPYVGVALEDIVHRAVVYLTRKGLQVTERSVKTLIKRYMARRTKKPAQTSQNRKSKGLPPSTKRGMVTTTRDTATFATAPVARTLRIRKQSKPKQKNISNGVVITHSEMLSSVVTHGTTLTYQCDSLVANPGRSVMFPWLSTIAANYDKYRFRKLSVSFVTNQPTSVGGKVGIGFDYDSTDPVPGDRIEFFALTHHTEGAVWDSLTLPIPCDNQTRFTNTHTTTDHKLIDLGQVLVMTDQVVATAANVGDIIVDYEVELIAAQQSLFSTQIARAMNQTVASGLDYFTSSQQAGPSHFTFITASVTQLFIGVSQGYYIMEAKIQDTGAAGGVTVTASAPTAGVTITSSGRVLANKYSFVTIAVKCSVPTGQFLITTGSNLSSCENVMFYVSRVNPAVYNTLIAAALD